MDSALPFFDPHPEMQLPDSPSSDDSVLLFFSSPTTHVEESPHQPPVNPDPTPPPPPSKPAPSSAAQPSAAFSADLPTEPSQPLSSARETDPFSTDLTSAPSHLSPAQCVDEVARLESIIASTSSPPPPPPPPPPPATSPHPSPSIDPRLLPAPQTKQEPAVQPTPMLTTSDSDSAPTATAPRRGFTRLGGRKRSLQFMHQVAKRNAPNVSLTDAELAEIGQMHESEQHLTQSKEIYTKLMSLKRCLAKYGYRITSLYLDAVSPEDAAETEQHPFAFVLNKNPQPAPPPSDKSDFSRNSEEIQEDVAGNRRSITMSTSDSSIEKEPKKTVEDGQSPRKRARTSDKADSSTQRLHFSTCTVCSKKMSDFATLVRHFRHAHQEMKPFMCPKCRGFYSSEGTLWHHISNVHSDSPRIHKCEYCDASYDSSGAKTRHVHGTHHTENPLYACTFPDCKRVFVFPAHLEQHAQVDHDGFRPFRCEECSKSFTSANGVARHSREVHRRDKAYTCPLCTTGLTKRCHLKRHLLNVHQLPPKVVDEEMKKHPNPGDISVMPPSASTG